MGASASCPLKMKENDDLLMKFKDAVYFAAGIFDNDKDVCDPNDPESCDPTHSSLTGDSQLKLQSFFHNADTNNDGKLDFNELDDLLKRLDLQVPEKMKLEMKSKMKNLLLQTIGQDSEFRLVFEQFLAVINRNKTPLVSKDAKRIVFVGATGSGKSSLCTAITGQDKKTSVFIIGNTAASCTVECKVEKYHWFGDPNEEEFVCVDTPGLDDELGRDEEHVNKIIEQLKSMDYVNAIVLVLNGQNIRFSASLQTMIRKFEEAFSKDFYTHTILCVTRWFMDDDSVEQREEDGITEESVAKDLNSKINNVEYCLNCHYDLPVAFIDAFYQRKDPRNGKKRLQKVQELVGDSVFRTADLNTVKPKIIDLSNMGLSLKNGSKMPSMQTELFDKGVGILLWKTEPDLPRGIVIDEKKGIISGIPEVAQKETEYKIFAESVGGWSDGFTFSIAIQHSSDEIQRIVMVTMKSIVDVIEGLLPITESGANGVMPVPVSEDVAKGNIEQARKLGNEKFEEAVEALFEEHGSICTFGKLERQLRASFESKFLQLERDYLVANQQSLSTQREKEKAAKDLELLYVSETINLELLDDAIKNAITLGVDQSIIDTARHWLTEISPGNCCYADRGCIEKGIKKDLFEHENLCVFGLPSRTKTHLKKAKVADVQNAKAVILAAKTEAFQEYSGKYKLDDNEYLLLNSGAERVQVIRPSEEDVEIKPGNEVEWVVTYLTEQDGPQILVAKSTNKADSVFKAVFADFKIDLPVALQWDLAKPTVLLNPASLKLLYFGGKWCPYCPPFSANLKKFYDIILRLKGKVALEIVFISSDRTETAMLEYYTQEHGNWYAIPYGERKLKEKLSTHYGVSGIPACYVLNNKSEPVSQYLDGKDVRTLLGEMATTPGDRQDKDAVRIYNLMQKAVTTSMKAPEKSSSNSEFDTDIFCSLRFGEAMNEAKSVRRLLMEQHPSLKVTIIDVPEGQDIGDHVSKKLDASKLVIIFGSETYGQGTASCFSTKEELQYIKDSKKPFFLIKMCDTFAEPRTRMILNGSVMYKLWLPNTRMPSDLISSIYKSFTDVASKVPPPAPADTRR